MFKMVSCQKKTFERLSRFCQNDGEFSQENLIFLGFWVAWMQPNMIDEDYEAENFYSARRFLTWVF